MSTSIPTKFLPPREYIPRFYESVMEFRVIEDTNSKFNTVYSMIPANLEDCWEDIRKKNVKYNVYACLNPLMHTCASRGQRGSTFKKVGGKTGLSTTVDKDIASYRWLYIDLDPKRAAKIPSSTEEKEKAFAKVEPIKIFMKEKGFADPVVADSGNGFHLYYRVDLPNTPESKDLVHRVLQFLHEKFSDEFVDVDKSVFNPARLTKLQGTWSRKGKDNATEDRYQRKSGFLEFPTTAEMIINSEDLLESVAIPAKKKTTKEFDGEKDQLSSVMYVQDFLEQHEVPYQLEIRDGLYKYFFSDGCPFNPEHGNKDACIIVNEDGMRIFKCFHNSCKDNHWAEFVKHYDPNYMTYEEREQQNTTILSEIFDEYGPEVIEEKLEASKDVDFNFIRDKKGHLTQDIHNFSEILNKDPMVKDLMGFNSFSYTNCNKTTNKAWSDADNSRVIKYIETKYRINKKDSFQRAMDIKFEESSYDPLKNMLETLEWDGKKRIDSALTDYLGAEPCEYTSFVSKLMFLGAVQRAFLPGCKYDTMVVIIGKQGFGKSTFCQRMALKESLFTDSLRDVGDKDSIETLAGAWIVEWGEMAVMKRVRDAETLKKFITQRVDKYRPAYARTVQEAYRRCVFIGTTNDEEFLTDTTGNRRFIPIQVSTRTPTKNVHSDEAEQDFAQMVAEAVYLFKQGERPYIPQEFNYQLEQNRENSVIEDPKIGIIRNWIQNHPEVQRICLVEIHKRALESTKELDRRTSNELSKILTHKCNLIKKDVYKFKEYGSQRHWVRDDTWDLVENSTEIEDDTTLFDDI